MTTTKLTLPKNLKFVLSDWPDDNFVPFRDGCKRLDEIARKSGSTSKSFQDAVDKLLQAVGTENTTTIPEVIKNATDVRACVSLLINDEKFSAECAIDDRLMEAFEKARPGLGRLNITNLVAAYFSRYDILNVGSLDKFGNYLVVSLSRFAGRGLSDDQKRILANSRLLFSQGAPIEIARAAVRTGRKLENVCAEKGLRCYANGIFFRACRFAFYIEQLREIPVGENHDILKYVVEPDVVNARADDSLLFGHKILEILIDRSPTAEISESWRDAILRIAGDPRVPHSNEKYLMWWSKLGVKRIAKMRGWLSRLDLKLFLEILESSAKDANLRERERMFESRKVFMEGLIDQQLVNDSRLILCDADVRYLNKYYDAEEVPEYARVHSPNTSMIYLDVMGLHMIEGSHSFKLKIMDKLPPCVQINDYTKTRFTDSELREAIVTNYKTEYRTDEGCLSKTHDQHLNWQHALINFLHRHGVKFPEQAVLSPERYRQYRRKFGLLA